MTSRGLQILTIGCSVASASSKYAYATVFHTPKSYEHSYFLGGRSALKSVAHVGTEFDLVALVPPHMPGKQKIALENDGVIVKVIEPTEVQKSSHKYHSDDWWLSFLKVSAWSLTDYEKVIVMDEKNIVLNNLDKIARCGTQLCGFYFNNDFFDPGFFVMKPDIDAYVNHMKHLDGAYAKHGSKNFEEYYFINSLYPDVADSPLWYDDAKHDGPTYRMDIKHHLSHVWWWEKMKWVPNFADGEDQVGSVSYNSEQMPYIWWVYPVTIFVPYGWWLYPWMTTVGYSIDTRNLYDSVWNYWPEMLFVLLCPVFHFLLTWLARAEWIKSWSPHQNPIRKTVSFSISRTPIAIQRSVYETIPYMFGFFNFGFSAFIVGLCITTDVPWYIGWTLFISYVSLLQWHLAKLCMVAFTSNGKLPEWRWVYAVYGFVPWVVWFVVCLLPVQIVYKDGAVKVILTLGVLCLMVLMLTKLMTSFAIHNDLFMKAGKQIVVKSPSRMCGKAE